VAELLHLLDVHLERGAPGSACQITARLLFSVPWDRGQTNMLRFVVQRYRMLVTPFVWAEQEGALDLPLTGEAYGVSVAVESMTLGHLTSEELAGHDWEPERRDRAGRDHLIVKLMASVLVSNEVGAEAWFDSIRAVTAEGEMFGPDFSTAQTYRSKPGRGGLTRCMHHMSCHFFDVTEVPKLSRVSVEVKRPVPFEEAWVPLPAD